MAMVDDLKELNDENSDQGLVSFSRVTGIQKSPIHGVSATKITFADFDKNNNLIRKIDRVVNFVRPRSS